jgi:hypothetical protein
VEGGEEVKCYWLEGDFFFFRLFVSFLTSFMILIFVSFHFAAIIVFIWPRGVLFNLSIPIKIDICVCVCVYVCSSITLECLERFQPNLVYILLYVCVRILCIYFIYICIYIFIYLLSINLLGNLDDSHC